MKEQSPEKQLAGFIAKFDPANAKLIRALRTELRKLLPTAVEIVYDNSVPALVISSPKRGERFSASVVAAGIAPVGSRVSVNGKAAPLDGKMRFRLMTHPVGRPPVVIFRVAQPSSPDVYTVRALRAGPR